MPDVFPAPAGMKQNKGQRPLRLTKRPATHSLAEWASLGAARPLEARIQRVRADIKECLKVFPALAGLNSPLKKALFFAGYSA